MASNPELGHQIRTEDVFPNESCDALNLIWAGGPGAIGATHTALLDVPKEVHPLGSRFAPPAPVHYPVL